jgi:glycosyltransferase involved in cell wall biosynthesis
MRSVDIVIITLNEAIFIGECLEALLRQNYPSGEIKIYVVDGGSTDGTVDIVQKYSSVTLIRSTEKGVALQRNVGTKTGQGELVGFLDAHCIVEPDWINLMAESFQDSAVAGCQGWIDFHYLDNPDEIQQGASKFQWATVSGAGDPYPWVMGGDAMFRREVLEGLGYFNPALSNCEDIDFSWRAILSGYQLMFVPKARLRHYESRNLRTMMRKYRAFGKGSAQLKHIYRIGGAPLGLLSLPGIQRHFFEKNLIQVAYGFAYILESLMLCSINRNRYLKHQYRPVSERFRPCFRWEDDTVFSISPEVLYWKKDPKAYVVLDKSRRFRLEFADSAFVLWDCLVRGFSKAQTLTYLQQYYAKTTDNDFNTELTAFIHQLIEEKLVVAEHRSAVAVQPA